MTTGVRVFLRFLEINEGKMIESPISMRFWISLDRGTTWGLLRLILSGYVPSKWIINQFFISDQIVWDIIQSDSHEKIKESHFLSFIKEIPLCVIGKSIGN